MDLSPQQLRKVEFRERWRGYDPDEVDDYLERVAAIFELLQERLRAATERAEQAETRGDGAGLNDDALQRTLVLAQRTADLVEQEAREEAGRLVAEAAEEAKAVVAEAGDTARRRIEEGEAALRADLIALERVRDELQHDVDALERWLEQARATVRRALQDELTRVDGLAPHLAPRPRLHDVEVPVPPGGEPESDGGPVAEGKQAAAEEQAAPVAATDGGPPTEPWLPYDDEDEGLGLETAGDVGQPDTGGTVPEGDVDYFADLREAMADDAPLGPREDDEPLPDEPLPDDLLEPGRFRSMLRRDRE